MKVLYAASNVASGSASTLGVKRISIEACSGVRPTYSLAAGVDGVLFRPSIVDVFDDVHLMKTPNWGSEGSEDRAAIKCTSPPSGHEGLAPDQRSISSIENDIEMIPNS